jgi:Spy/CpxP family protein refolding chaperone
MKRILQALLLTAGLSGVAVWAVAQPQHRWHSDGGDPLSAMKEAKDQLNLNTSQQQQWDNAVAQSKSAHAAMRANFGQVKTAMQAELAKTEPDFAATAAVADSAEQQNSALRKQSRSAWLALYSTFSSEQKTIVRDAVQARMAKMAAAHAARVQPSTN